MSMIGSHDNVLVTGGAGFIGSHLVKRLADTGATVKVLDNFDDFYPGKTANLARYRERSNVEVVQGSILDRDILGHLCRWASIVFHEAAKAGIRYCNLYPVKAHKVNVEGTLNLLMACREANPGPRRVVNASSSSVYGEIDHLPIREEDPKRPGSPYAATKLAAEHYCTAFHKTYGLDVVSLRYFSVYGPSQRPDLVISTFARNLVSGERPVIYGDGTHSRDFTHVTDIVEGTILAAQTKGVAGGVFNLGRGERTTVMELLIMMADILRLQVEPLHRSEFSGEFPHTQADISLAREKLGYRPRISVREGLESYLEWYLSEGRSLTGQGASG